MSDKPLVYLASPYSHEDSRIREERFRQVCIAAGYLLSKGLVVFSPIAHFHPIADVTSLPTDWKFWENVCRGYLSVCNKVFVLRIPGWETSVGVGEEIAIAKELNIPIEFINLSDFPGISKL